MKKILVIILSFFAGIGISDAQSMLKVRLADNRPLNVWLDGRYFNKRGTSVTVGDLPRGRHTLRIYAMTQTRRGRPYEDIVYEGRVTTYDGMITQFYYDPYSGQADVKEQNIITYLPDHRQPMTGDYQGETGGNTPDYSRRNDYYNNNDNTNADNNTNNDNNTHSEPASPVAPESLGTLTDNKITKLKNKLETKKTETEKMNLLKEGLNDETFTTDQVGVMMDWFSFESSKVEFAEWAYTKTVDKEVFESLEAKLSYKNYKEELEKFLKARN